ncbi:hypothetical protein Aperf_G00000023040 [Anoplocephala perfoliata]
MAEETGSFVLPLIFTITSGIALLGLSIFTVIAVYRRQLPRCLHLFLTFICVGGASALTAFLLCHYGLKTQAFHLALGDQLLLAPWEEAEVDSRLLSHFCHSLRVTSDKPGVTVWSASISPNRETDKNYTLILTLSKEPPTVIPLRLSTGDRLTVKSAPSETQMAIYAHDQNWYDWETAGFQQEAHEVCCAWWQLRPIRPPVTLKIETSGQHRLVLRGSSGGNVELAITRSLYTAAVCDPVVCDAIRVNACRLDVFEKPSILEVRVGYGSENDFDTVRVWISCEHRGWAIALFSTSIPLFIISGISLALWCRRRQQRIRSSMRSMTSPVYAYPGAQGSNSLIGGVGGGGMKQGVDFV